MATVTLRNLWINRADNPSEYLEIEGTITEVQAVRGEVRVMANGRRRVVTRTGSRKEYAVSANRLTIDEVEILASWAGSVLWYRDPQGRKVSGTFFDLSVTPWNGHQLASVSLTFSNVTASEAV